AHYGTLRKSGRYPWGSGDPDSQRNKDYSAYVNGLKKHGMSEAEIAKGEGVSVKTLRARISLASAEKRQNNIGTAQRHKDAGWGNSEIARRMGVNESTVRSWLAPGAQYKQDATQTTANVLKDEVSKKGMIDVGVNVNYQMGITQTRLDTAVAALVEEGYVTHNLK